MNIALGIHVGHDRGACIIKDRVVLGAIAQERLDRIKYSRSSQLPFQAIDALLRYHNLKISDVSCVGLSYDGLDGDSILDLYREEFQYYYHLEHIPFYIVNHHDAHAYATYHASKLKDSLILVADGAGDYIGGMQEAETLYMASNGNIQRISQRLQSPAIRRLSDDVNYIYPRMPAVIRNAPVSIGRKYEQITHLIGFGWGEAGKTMGLASYGQSFMKFDPQQYKGLDFSLNYEDIIVEVFLRKQCSGKRFQTYMAQDRANIARTVQDFVETCITSLIQSFMEHYHCRNICLSGGLFLNCLTNQKIIDTCQPDKLFIVPCSGDDGQALGCAYYAYSRQFGVSFPYDIQLPYLGLSYDEEEILQSIRDKNIPYQRLDDEALIGQMASCIAKNEIIALHRGRSEIGPRALCHRSILANPANQKMKDILNHRVKHREAFRPFAPAVIAEAQYDYFDLKTDSDYMLLATTVKEAHRGRLASITHVDNTARIQTISYDSDPFLHTFLLKLKTLTGYPVILNTSFNVAGEPIVESPLDALNTFLKTDIDALVIGNYYLHK